MVLLPDCVAGLSHLEADDHSDISSLQLRYILFPDGVHPDKAIDPFLLALVYVEYSNSLLEGS